MFPSRYNRILSNPVFCVVSLFVNVKISVAMEKKVFCLIGPRCKCIKYRSDNITSDTETIRRRLLEACETDSALALMLNKKSIIFQKCDPDRNNKLCDIEDDEEIADKSDVTVLLISNHDEIHQPIILPGKSDETVPCEIEVLYKEPLIDGQTCKHEKEYKYADSFQNNNNLTDGMTDKVNKNIPIINSHKQKVDEKLHSPLTFNQASNTTAMRLPPLPSHLETKVKTLGAITVQNSLIQFWSSHLLDVTNEKPTKTDYFNIASSIVESFPDLCGGKDGHGIMKQQLSTHIRNRRANMKRHGIKRDIEGRPKVSSASFVATESSNDTLSEKKDTKDAMAELEKSRNVGDYQQSHQHYMHIRRLLQETLTTRRMWIEKEAANTMDVVTKFPQLKLPDFILFEFYQIKKIKEEIAMKNVDTMINKLAVLFEVNIKDERDKSNILVKLQAELLNKRFSRNTTPLITVKEKLGSTDCLTTAKNDSPRLVLFMDDNGVASAFIVADGKLTAKILEPTISKSLVCLLASYYTWHIRYPTAYASTLQYIDAEVSAIDIIEKANTRLLKFIRRINIAVQEATNKAVQ